MSTATRTESLDDLIAARGLPIEKLAKEAGVSVRSIYRLRPPRSTTPTNGVVALLAIALKVPEAYLRRACGLPKR